MLPVQHINKFTLIFRNINKQQEENGEISQELLSKIQDIVANIDQMKFDDDSIFDDDSSDDESDGDEIHKNK